jgi:hypothetical protein
MDHLPYEDIFQHKIASSLKDKRINCKKLKLLRQSQLLPFNGGRSLMKTLLIALTLLSSTTPAFSDGLDDFQKDNESIWRTGSGSEDGTFTAIAISMFGWGIGLAAGIAILASVLHQSTAGHAHTSSDSD